MSILRKGVKKDSKIKQQQQTLITSKMYVRLKSKANKKVKMASEKTETNPSNL